MGRSAGNLYPGDRAMMAIRTVFHLFCDCWKLYREYITRELEENTLDDFIKESGEIFRKYEQDPFTKDLLLAVINEIERREVL